MDQGGGVLRPTSAVRLRRTVGSRVANSASSTRTSAPVSRLSSADFPVLVYPVSATEGTRLRRRRERVRSRRRPGEHLSGAGAVVPD